jgi:hypothetical protein
VNIIESMFDSATAYNQNLCTWGTKLQKTARVDSMFSGSGCANKAAPNLTLVPPGPFCAFRSGYTFAHMVAAPLYYEAAASYGFMRNNCG